MLKKFLKRFERLENIPPDNLVRQGIKISRRFERLEISDRKIEVAITDKITQEEKAPPGITYFVFCPYCGQENNSASENCVFCKRSLRTKLAESYQGKLLKRCLCGAANVKERNNCWACGREFFLQDGKQPKIDADNTIILNIDGQEYKSTDKDLPFEIRILMEKIRREGYKKELIDEWVKQRKNEAELKKDTMAYRIRDLRLQYNSRIVYLGVGIAFFILIVLFRSCLR